MYKVQRPTERQIINIIGLVLNKPYIVNYKQELSQEDDHSIYFGDCKILDASNKSTVVNVSIFEESNYISIRGYIKINKAYSGKLTSAIDLKSDELNNYIKTVEKNFKRLQIIHKEAKDYNLQCMFQIYYDPKKDTKHYLDLKLVNEMCVDIKALTDRKMTELGYGKSYEKTSLRDLQTVKDMIDI
jgi:hypothetical protein